MTRWAAWNRKLVQTKSLWAYQASGRFRTYSLYSKSRALATTTKLIPSVAAAVSMRRVGDFKKWLSVFSISFVFVLLYRITLSGYASYVMVRISCVMSRSISKKNEHSLALKSLDKIFLYCSLWSSSLAKRIEPPIVDRTLMTVFSAICDQIQVS